MSLLDIGTELRHERYFDSHPRVGDDFAADGADLRGFISIRTLAWGVTCAVYPVSLQTEISIRTPAWGVTRSLAQAIKGILISIRTPAWGVTSERAEVRPIG